MKNIVATVMVAAAMVGAAHAEGLDPATVDLYQPLNPNAVFNTEVAGSACTQRTWLRCAISGRPVRSTQA